MNGLRQVWRDIWTAPLPLNAPLAESAKFDISSGPVASSTGLSGKKQARNRRARIGIAIPLNRNDKIRIGLERAYPTEHKTILDQAYGAYYFQNPASQNLPELYELLESGFLDQGIEASGLHQWSIGRPK